MIDEGSLIVRCGKCGQKNRVPRMRISNRPICGRCGSPLSILNTSTFHPVDVTDNSFSREVLEFPGLVLVDCWAQWCASCRMIAPILDQLASDYSGRIKIAKLNVDENPAVSAQYGIRSIPTLLFFKNGKLLNQLVGAVPREAIEEHIRNLL